MVVAPLGSSSFVPVDSCSLLPEVVDNQPNASMQRVPAMLRATARLTRVPARRYGGGEHKTFKELDEIYKSSMDHLPKPSGSWEAGFRAKDRNANIAFGASLAIFLLTCAEMEREGCFDLLFNPAYWSDRQVARQAEYYEKGNQWRVQPDADDDE